MRIHVEGMDEFRSSLRRPITDEDRRRAVEAALRSMPRAARISPGQRRAILHGTAYGHKP